MDYKGTYDFIIVGSGPAGCAAAWRLTSTNTRPTVLLVEAGDDLSGQQYRRTETKWLNLHETKSSWGFKSTPQPGLNDRVIDYSGGLGFGGSSLINFGVYAVGAEGDYDRWADIVGDDTFNWQHARECFRSLNTIHSRDIEQGSGPLHVGYDCRYDDDVQPLIDTFMKFGSPNNADHNSGNPIGVSRCIYTERDGVRSLAQDLLTPCPSNLTVLLKSRVSNVILEGKEAIGICLMDGTKYLARKEVILFAGTLNTPHILMHSGIGPAEELKRFQISVQHQLPGVGQGLLDHLGVRFAVERRQGSNGTKSQADEINIDYVVKHSTIEHTSTLSQNTCQGAVAWFKCPQLYQRDEFRALPGAIQDHLMSPTVPQLEILTHIDRRSPGVESCVLAIFAMNTQSRGTTVLQSSDPRKPLLVDPQLLSHPFDRLALLEGLKILWKFVRSPGFSVDTIGDLFMPRSGSDDDLNAFIEHNAYSIRHPTGTARMGREDDPQAVVDAKFKVKGLHRLRVADMSVVPLMTSNHTQTTAYFTGMTCGDIIAMQYGLNSESNHISPVSTRL